MPPTNLLRNWSEQQTAQMHNAIFVAEHRLAELEMFHDEGLIATLDRHPRRDLGINTMGTDPAWRSEWQEGIADDLDGRTLLEVCQTGRIWLNLRRVMDHHPEYRLVVNTMYDELEALCGWKSIFNRSANLLISSPTALVYYHVDCPANMLWHIRGRKRVWAYPLESGVVSPQTIEAVLCGEKSEEVEYTPELDRVAEVVDLEPGQMITWPQHTPHRVVNTSGLNVSLSTEHLTQRTLRKNNVYLANRHFRRLLGGGFTSTETDGLVPAAKEVALRIARRLPWIAPTRPAGYEYPKTFAVDPKCVNGVRPLTESPQLAPRAIAVPIDCPTIDVPAMH